MKEFSVQKHSTNSDDNTGICLNNKHFMLAFILYFILWKNSLGTVELVC